MADSSVESAARGISLAIAAGAVATTNASAGAALKDRHDALKRAISRRSPKLSLRDLEENPRSEATRTELAKNLAEHGATKSRDVITIARELLALVKGDDDSREAVGALLEDIEKTLIELADVEGEDDAPPQAGASSPTAAPRSSARDLGSQRLPPDEPSKTELERSLLPFWKRTDNFFLKAGVLVGAYVAAAVIYFLFIRTPTSEALERCRKGDQTGCWLVVATEDAVAETEKISTEPLQTLCDQHGDPCGCVGLAYVKSAAATGADECDLLKKASERDSKWPCSCTRYKFWRGGQQRTAHCGDIPKCE